MAKFHNSFIETIEMLTKNEFPYNRLDLTNADLTTDDWISLSGALSTNTNVEKLVLTGNNPSITALTALHTIFVPINQRAHNMSIREIQWEAEGVGEQEKALIEKIQSHIDSNDRKIREQMLHSLTTRTSDETIIQDDVEGASQEELQAQQLAIMNDAVAVASSAIRGACEGLEANPQLGYSEPLEKRGTRINRSKYDRLEARIKDTLLQAVGKNPLTENEKAKLIHELAKALQPLMTKKDRRFSLFASHDISFNEKTPELNQLIDEAIAKALDSRTVAKKAQPNKMDVDTENQLEGIRFFHSNEERVYPSTPSNFLSSNPYVPSAPPADDDSDWENELTPTFRH